VEGIRNISLASGLKTMNYETMKLCIHVLVWR